MKPEKPNGEATHAVDDPDAPATAEEIAAAEALRDALADPSIDHEGAALARAASVAHSPRALAPADLQAIVDRAVANAPKQKTHSDKTHGGGRVIRVAFGVAAALSMAAAAVLVMGRDRSESAVSSAAPHAQVLTTVRSTQPLFQEPFARSGGGSARIDRIARARGADLRENRFALRGVR
jgi:hypothetical protein